MNDDPLDFVDTDDRLFWPFIAATVGLVAYLAIMIVWFRPQVFFWAPGFLIGLFYALFTSRMKWGEWF